jgi:hypothetical protein
MTQTEPQSKTGTRTETGTQSEKETQPEYLLSVYQPDGPMPAAEDLARIQKDLDALHGELKASGAWVFAGGLHPSSTATVVQLHGGHVLTTDGPFAEGKEHLGGFTIIRAPDLDAALGWGRRLAEAITLDGQDGLPIEVRPFQHQAEG